MYIAKDWKRAVINILVRCKWDMSIVIWANTLSAIKNFQMSSSSRRLSHFQLTPALFKTRAQSLNLSRCFKLKICEDLPNFLWFSKNFCKNKMTYISKCFILATKELRPTSLHTKELIVEERVTQSLLLSHIFLWGDLKLLKTRTIREKIYLFIYLFEFT